MRRGPALLAALALAGCTARPPALEPQARPPVAADEAGHWLVADRMEQALRNAPDRIRDPALTAYAEGVACRLAGPYCPDIRVYLVRRAGFNAGMLPNGTLILRSGLLLRLADEAQLAAVIGHELGHYIHRDTFAQAERARQLGDLTAWMGLFGLALGVAGGTGAWQAGVELDRLAYGRDQERVADAFGLERMAAAGYDPAAGAEVWTLVQAEAEASGASAAGRLLATHPAPAERRQRLTEAAAGLPGSADRRRGRAAYRAALAPYRAAFLADEVRLRQPTATLVLFRHLAARDGLDGQLAFAWGEVYRLRGWKGDREKALARYAKALAFADAPAETHRSIGLVRRALGQSRGARFAFERYLAHAPRATDRAVVAAYIDGTL